jgi:nitroreductase
MTVQSLLNRFSLGGKYLTEPGPSQEDLELIVSAALRAPDHGELTPFRFVVIEGEGRARLADLFESYAKRAGKSEESCKIERARALEVPVSVAVIACIDAYHPLVPAHEQWMCVGGAVTNVLNALHMMGFAGKMLSGGKVRDTEIIEAFCKPGESLVGWIAIGTPSRALTPNKLKWVQGVISHFKS